MKKTLMQKLDSKISWLPKRICKQNKKDKQMESWISEETVRKAIKWEKVRFNSLFEIWIALWKIWVIDISKTSLNDLFNLVDNNE